MTKAIFKRHNNIYRVLVEGHATGNTEVCAAASAFAITLHNCLVVEHNRGNIIILQNLDIDPDEPRAYYKFKALPGNQDYIDGLITAFACGFGILSEKFPDHVQLTTKIA